MNSRASRKNAIDIVDLRIPTFHRNPRQPNLRLPPGSWDTHCHILGPKETFPFASNAAIDPADAPKEKLFALHAVLGIERCVIVQSAVHGMDNRAVEDALAAKNGKYLGVALLAATTDKAELRRLDRAGFRGVRFNFMNHLPESASIEEVVAFARRLAEVGWHLQIHTDSSRLSDMAPVLEGSPVPVVIDHIGRIDARLGLQQAPFQRLLRLMQDGRFWVKVSGCDRITRTGPPYQDALPFARELVSRFPDRVLWGTDWPHPHHAGPIPDDAQLLEMIAEIAPGEELRRKLMVDNPSRLYDLLPRQMSAGGPIETCHEPAGTAGLPP
jgi:2-pyrone-4,6-dicarboxylate lactonase